MTQQAPPLDQTFRSAVVEHFGFLTVQWNLEYCGSFCDDLADPRDRRNIVRYRSNQVFVDIVLTYIELGLFVYLWSVPPGVPRGPCWEVRPINVTNFDQFLQARLGDTIPPIFAGIRKSRYLTEMYNEQPARYAKLMASRLPEAIERTAARFERFGRDAVQFVLQGFRGL